MSAREQLLSQRFDGLEFEEIDGHAFESDAGGEGSGDGCTDTIEETLDALEEVSFEAAQGGGALAGVAGGEEEVEGLCSRPGEEELVDQAAADAEAQAAG